MSLLDDVSIVVTPNGYKAGELYAVVPEPSEGSEEVTDGNFPSPNTSWSLSGWEILGNLAKNSVDGAGNNLYQGSVTSVNQLFKVVITATITAGSVKVMLGGGTGGYNEIGEATSTGTFTYYGTSFGTDNRILLQTGTGSVIGSVQLSNISVKEYTSADMDVTRATAATRVDENGLVNYAEIIGGEEVTNGDFSSSSDWNLGTNSIVSSNKATLTITSGGLQYATNIGLDVVNTKTYKITFTANRTSGTGDLEFGYGSGLSVSGSPTISASGTQTIYFQPTYNTNDFGFKSKTTSGDYVWEISNVSVKEVTRDNVPRIDYTGGGCPHILAEPQRTNLITYSEDFSSWNKLAAVVTTNQTTSPSGTLTADKITYDGTTYGRVEQTVAVTNGNTYSWSVYLKNNDLSDVTQVWLGFSQAGQGEFVTITNEWQRYETVQVANGSNEYPRVQFTGTGSLYAWGAQLEEGSYATSYIPTSGSTVTRNQDIFTRDGIGSLINDSEGVLFVEMAALSDDGTLRCITLSDGGTTNRVLIIYNTTSNSIRAVVVSNAGTSFDELHTVTSTLDFHKIAIKWKLNDFAFWIDGVEVATDTSGAAPIGLDRIVFDVGNGTYDFYGKVKQLQVYNTALTDEQLEALTS